MLGWTFRFTLSRSAGGAVPRPESECPLYALFDGGTLDLCAGEEAGGAGRLRDKPGAERAQQGQSGPCVAGSGPCLDLMLPVAGRVAAQTGSWLFSSRDLNCRFNSSACCNTSVCLAGHQRVVLLHDIIGGHGRAEDLRQAALLEKLLPQQLGTPAAAAAAVAQDI